MPSTSSLVIAVTGPVPTTCPFFITATRSARSNTSWMSWLMRKMPMPSAFSCLMRSPTCSRLLRPERRRRLVHDEDAGVEMDRARDRHRLPLAARQRLHRVLEAAEIRIEPPHHLPRLRLHRDVVERAPARAQLAPEEQIGGGVDIVGERQRLIDRLDAVSLGVARIVDLRFLAVDEDRAAVALIGARQHLDQRRLAGAVVAEQADDLAGIEIDRGVVDRLDAAESDRDVASSRPAAAGWRLERSSAPLSSGGGGRSGRSRPRTPAPSRR